MDKRTKHQRHKTLSPEELAELGPGKASFDTEAGRAAQGMRPDLGNAGKGMPEEQSPAEPPPVHTGNPPSEDSAEEDDDVT
jgi:hypothetical protein